MKIKELSLKNNFELVTIHADARVSNAVALMNQHNIGALPVCNSSGELIGIISERDVVRCLSESRLGVDGLTVEKLMTSDVQTCSPDDDINEIIVAMEERQIRHIPVLTAGRLCTIVSSRDILAAALTESKSNLSNMVLAYEMGR